MAFLAAPSPVKAVKPSYLLTSVKMIDAKGGWAIGTTGQSVSVLRTTDGGGSWENVSPTTFYPQPPDEAESFNDGSDGHVAYYFFSNKSGWVAKGNIRLRAPSVTIYHTRDAGQHWSHTTIQQDYYNLHLNFVDEQHGFMLATSGTAGGQMGKALYTTNDAGLHWSKVINSDLPHAQKTLPVFGFYPNGVLFESANRGYVSGSNRRDFSVPLYETSNSGKTWQQDILAPPSRFSFSTIYTPLLIGGHGWLLSVVSDQKINRIGVYVLDEADRKWHSVKFLDMNGIFEGLSFFLLDIRHGWILNSTGTEVYATQDGGLSWITLPQYNALGGTQTDQSNLDDIVPGLQFLNDYDGWLLTVTKDGWTGARTSSLLRTRDGGKSWKVVYVYKQSGIPGLQKPTYKIILPTK